MPIHATITFASYRVPIYTPRWRAAMWIKCLSEGQKVPGIDEKRTRNRPLIQSQGSNPISHGTAQRVTINRMIDLNRDSMASCVFCKLTINRNSFIYENRAWYSFYLSQLYCTDKKLTRKEQAIRQFDLSTWRETGFYKSDFQIARFASERKKLSMDISHPRSKLYPLDCFTDTLYMYAEFGSRVALS